MTTVIIVLSTFALLIDTTHSALTNCNFLIDNSNCLCVWDKTYTRFVNGQYRLIDPLNYMTPTPPPTDKRWIMDDIKSPQSAQPCSSFAEVFWYSSSPCIGRWWLSNEDDVDVTDPKCIGDCFCNNNGVTDPQTDTCPSTYQCWNQGVPEAIDTMTIFFGRCPQITKTCDHIKVTAASPRDICNGIYNKIDYSPTGLTLDNEINIYVNANQTARNKFVYYDHHIQRWVCAEIYKPCQGDFPSPLIYLGTENDPGSPDPFKDASAITTGDTWTVQEWLNALLGDTSAVPVTFECNPPTPPPVTAPTADTDMPTATPSKTPSKTPTQTPLGTPTKHPSETPSKTPTKSPTKTPTTTPSNAPVRTPHPTSTPSKTPSETPTQSPIGGPTQNPTKPGETHMPTNSPTTADPTISPTSPTNIPTDYTSIPTRGPTRPGETRAPSTSAPTPATPTPKPTQLTFPPTDDPTHEPTDKPDGEDDGGDSGEDDQGNNQGDYGWMVRINMEIIVILIAGYLMLL